MPSSDVRKSSYKRWAALTHGSGATSYDTPVYAHPAADDVLGDADGRMFAPPSCASPARTPPAARASVRPWSGRRTLNGLEPLHELSVVTQGDRTAAHRGIGDGVAAKAAVCAGGARASNIRLSARGMLVTSGVTLGAPGEGETTIHVLAAQDVFAAGDGPGEVRQHPPAGTMCFAAGTRLRTRDGELPVERLTAGDMLATQSGERVAFAPVRRIGFREIDLAAHPRPETAAPVRIRRGALGEGLPVRDLVVAPEQAMLVDGRPVAALALVDDATVVQERPAKIGYFEVELDRRSVLFAEGAPAAGRLDAGDRNVVSNGVGSICEPAPDRRHVVVGDGEGCEGPASFAAATEDAGLRVVVGGTVLRPMAVTGRRHVFAVPEGATSIRLASRAASPSRPGRRGATGVSVSRIVLRGDDDVVEIAVDDARLAQGWHAVERTAGGAVRRTDGDAVLPLPALEGRMVLEIVAECGA